jgi:ADP-L-glycero-D-manno-heptose 6-epimerase
MSYYILTGTNGLVGSQLKKEVEKNNNVKSITKKWINSFTDQDELKNSLDLLINKSIGVYHNGAITDTSDFSADVMYYNYHITKLFVDSCWRWKKKLVFASTQMTMGRKELGYPENIYGWSKVACEDYGILKAGKFIALRYTNVYGPGEEHKGKTSSLGYQAWLNKKIDLWDSERDFVYVKDVVDANIFAMNEMNGSGIYWVGSGKSEKAFDFVRGMGEDIYIITKKEAPPAWFQWKTSSDSKDFMPGWKPKYDIESGTEDYVKYLEIE